MWKNSLNKSFSILETKPLEWHTFHYFFLKLYCFFLTPIVPSSSTISVWLPSYDMKSCLKGYPLKVVWTNDHFQIVIIVETLFKQSKMFNPIGLSPSWSSKLIHPIFRWTRTSCKDWFYLFFIFYFGKPDMLSWRTCIQFSIV